MDPNTCLEEILQICSDIRARDYCDDTGEAYSYEIIELVDRIDNLHGWLSKGGFLPQVWGRGR